MSIQWKEVPFANRHFVSSTGLIRGPKGITAGYKNARGYMRFNINRRGYAVHRLVLLAFLGPSDLEVNHKNGIKHDNRLENLEYVTKTENMRHAHRTGLVKVRRGEENGRAKLRKHQLLDIRKMIKSKVLDKDIAKAFGVHRTLIGFIRRGVLWKNV